MIAVHDETVVFMGQRSQMTIDQRGRSPTFIDFVGSIMKNKEEEFMADMKKLSSSESFDLVCFEETIDKVRNYVAEVSSRTIINLLQSAILTC